MKSTSSFSKILNIYIDKNIKIVLVNFTQLLLYLSLYFCRNKQLMRLINNKLIIISNHIVVPLLFNALESLSSFSFISLLLLRGIRASLTNEN